MTAWIDSQLAAVRVVAAYRERQMGLQLTRRQIIRTWLGSMRKANRAKRHGSVRKRIAQWDKLVGFDPDWEDRCG